jgi:hypothetical protein
VDHALSIGHQEFAVKPDASSMRVAAAIDLTDRSVDFPWRRWESAPLLKSADAEPRDGLSAWLFMTIVTARVRQQRGLEATRSKRKRAGQSGQCN